MSGMWIKDQKNNGASATLVVSAFMQKPRVATGPCSAAFETSSEELDKITGEDVPSWLTSRLV